jgi:hypothetical protein
MNRYVILLNEEMVRMAQLFTLARQMRKKSQKWSKFMVKAFLIEVYPQSVKLKQG